MRVHIGPYVDWVGPYQLAEYFKHLNIFIVAAQLVFNGLMWILAPILSPSFAAVIIGVNEWLEKKKFEDYRDDRLHKLGEFFAHGFSKEEPEHDVFRSRRKERHKTWLYKLCEWIHEKKKRKVKIKIDRWDTWNVDSTMALIMLPMLKQLKETKHGSGYIDLEDVPEELRYTETEEYDAQECFDFYKEATDKLQCDIHARYEWVLDEMIWTFEQLQPDYDWEAQYSSGEIDWVSVPCQWDEEGKPTMYTMKDGPDMTYKVDWDARSKHQARIDNGLRLFGKYYCTLWD